MDFERPPKDASVDNLLELCEVLREGSKEFEDLFEQVEQGKTLVRDNIRYGVGLGFLRETEEEVEATSRGVEASYNQEIPEALAEQFREGLEDYPLYRTVIGEITAGDESPIKKSDVLRHFRTSVGLEGSESTLGSAATTFIQTLDAAGFGEYIVGRGGNETRLEVAEDFEKLVDQVTESKGSEAAPGEDTTEIQSQTSVGEDATSINNINSMPIQINIELTGVENPNEVENLIVGVRRGLTRDIDKLDGDQKPESSEHDEIPNHSEIETSDREGGSEPDDEADSTNSDQSLDTFVESESNSDDQ